MADARPAVWAGRLAAGLDPRAQRLNDSLPVDGRLWPEELALLRAYATTLGECGVLSPGDHDALQAACHALEGELATGAVALAGEDVHSAVEAGLERHCGEPARRLHTGRSRNDQDRRVVLTQIKQDGLELLAGLDQPVRDMHRKLLGHLGKDRLEALASRDAKAPMPQK